MLEDNENSPKGIQKNSRLAYHIKLSFSPDDPVTPERVHELGVEFAHRITSDEYKFVVATHTDRHHLHDHIRRNYPRTSSNSGASSPTRSARGRG